MKLYASIRTSKGKVIGKGDNKSLTIELNINGVDGGDIELNNKNGVITIDYITQSGFCSPLATFKVN